MAFAQLTYRESLRNGASASSVGSESVPRKEEVINLSHCHLSWFAATFSRVLVNNDFPTITI